MPNDVLIRNLEVRDLQGVSAVHMAAFPTSALTLLGKEAVRRYYEWLLLGPHDVVALGAFTDRELVGFCFGGRFHRAMSGFLRKNRPFLIWRVLMHPWLMANPTFHERFNSGLDTLRRSAKPQSYVQFPAEYENQKRARRAVANCFAILSIAVHPRCQGLSLGKMLMKESEEVAGRRGFRKMSLTVHPDNQQAITFYERLNWKKFSKNGVWQGMMRKALDS